MKYNWEIDTLKIGDMIYLVFKSKNKEATHLFPNGLKISGNRFVFKESYTKYKQENILKSIEEVKNDLIHFFGGVQKQLKEIKDKKQKRMWVLKYGTTENNEFVHYLRFIGTDVERLGFPHGLSINEKMFNKNEMNELNEYTKNVDTFFNLTFTKEN